MNKRRETHFNGDYYFPKAFLQHFVPKMFAKLFFLGEEEAASVKQFPNNLRSCFYNCTCHSFSNLKIG